MGYNCWDCGIGIFELLLVLVLEVLLCGYWIEGGMLRIVLWEKEYYQMAPKKKQKQDATASSLSTNFYQWWFWDATSESNYAAIMVKSMQRECGNDMTH